MAIRQSEIATGQKTVPQAFVAGTNVSYLSEFVVPAGMTVATGDIVELAVLPAFHHVVSAQIIPDGDFGASVTADIGIMSGDVGSTDTSRTSGDELFDAVALTAMASLSTGEAILLEPVDHDRSIGVKFSAAITGAGQKIVLQISMTQ